MKPLIKTTLLAGVIAFSLAAYAQAPTADDRAFVAKVSQGGMFEVAAGKLAATKGSTQDVRDFAAAEVHDHTLVGNKLKNISAKAGITFALKLNADFSAKLKKLSLLSGVKFDEAYLSEMGEIHDMDGAAFATEATRGGTPAYRAFGSETHKIVQRHIGAIKAVPAG